MNRAHHSGAIRAWFYLLLNFLLGVFYFTFLVTGFSLGFGLLIVLVGLPILRFMLSASGELARFDRALAARLLQADRPSNDVSGSSSALYLLAKFPIGILSLILAVLLTPLALLALFLNSETEAGMIAGQLLTGLAGATSGLSFASEQEARTTEPARDKPKRGAKAKRLDLSEEDSDMVYYLGDDGELRSRRK